MLYELIQLPNRVPEDYVVSTQVMMFSDINSRYGDEPNVYGCEVDGGYKLYCGEINKYKSVETFGDIVIERLLLSEDPIKLDRKWWMSQQNVTVLQSKMFTQNGTYVIKNVNGILTCDNYDMFIKEPQPSSALYNMYRDFLGQVITHACNDSATAMKFTDFIPDTDIDLVKVIQECDFNWNNFFSRGFDIGECPKYFGGINIVPDLSILPYRDPDVSLKLFANFINIVSAEIGEYQRYCDNIKMPFDPEYEDIISSVNYNWYLLELLYKLNSAHYASIKIKYNLNRDRMPVFQGVPIYKQGKSSDMDLTMTRLFKNWVNDIVKSCITPVDKATLVKTWSEEVFIELSHMRRVVKRYYFDMIPVIIGTIALH